MTRPKHKRISRGHKLLIRVIEQEFEGNQRAASRAAVAAGFPVSGEKETAAIVAINRLVNGFVHFPNFRRALWLQEHWKIPVESWDRLD